jgi:hypothetical protein
MIINRQDLLAPFAEKNFLPKNFIVSDKTYFIPTESLLNESIYPNFKIWLETLKLSKWEHKWDCDNFADAFKLFACGYYDQNIDSEAEGIAIGVVNYIANIRAEDGSKGGHAVNIFYTENSNGTINLSTKFIEPQTGHIYTMTEDEFKSIWTVYI